MDGTIKPQTQVLAEYLAASTPGHWMVDEVGEYLFPDGDDVARENGLEDVFDRIDEERRRFSATHIGPSQLTEFSLLVQQRGSTALEGKYAAFPSPVLLLELCLKLAEPGDQITVTHRYGSGDECRFESAWPFGMDWAVLSTTPMAERLSEELDDPHEVDAEPRKPGERWRLPALLMASAGAGATIASGFLRRRRR